LIDNKAYANLYVKNEKFIIKININNYDYLYNFVITLYQALLQKGWYMPRFCFHSKLSVSGNCRMCFVEVKNISKPVISCATNILNNQVVYTNTLLTFKARENILEFILINHPIDCPICDQGGECDLQDQYTVLGSLNSRFYESFKKSVKSKNISLVIKLSLKKCINCSRCSRFAQQIIGDYSFSLLGRGENSNISNYNKLFFNSEISSNVMDLCPVGALTSKIISYDFRIWELIDLRYVDTEDVIHPNIRIDFRGLRVQRILPTTNSDINEEWISDDARFSYNFFFKNRFYLPKIKSLNKFVNYSWINFSVIFKNLFFRLTGFFDDKKMFFLKNVVFDKYRTDLYIISYYNFFLDNFSLAFSNKYNFIKNNVNRACYLFKNKDIDFLKVESIYIYFINFRFVNPILNYKVREKMIFDYINVFIFGSSLNLNYFYKFIGNSFKFFLNFFKKNNFKSNFIMFYNDKRSAFLNFFSSNKYKYNIAANSLNINFSELGYCKNNFLNAFIKSFAVNFNNSSMFYNKNSFKKSIYFYLNQNFLNIKYQKFFIPKKFNFEQSSMFINIFGVFNDFTFLSYKSDHKSLKNDWSFLNLFFKKLSFFKNLSLSKVKLNFVSKKWLYSFYNNLIFIKEFCVKKKFVKYFNNFYKNCEMSLLKFKLNKVIKQNINSSFVNLININKISWLF